MPDVIFKIGVPYVQKGEPFQNTVTFCIVRLPKNKSCNSYSSAESQELKTLLEHMYNCKASAQTLQ